MVQLIDPQSIEGDDEEDTRLLRLMAIEAEKYVRSHRWCLELKECKFTGGYGGIIALFLFRVLIRGCAQDEWIWVIVGDLPSVYLEKKGFATPHSALKGYIEGMEEWIVAARARDPLDGLIPLGISDPNEELISGAEARIETIREHFLPSFSRCEY